MAEKNTASEMEVTVIDFDNGLIKEIIGPLHPKDRQLANKPNNTSVTAYGAAVSLVTRTPKGGGNGKHKVEIELTCSIGDSSSLRAPSSICYGPCNPTGIPCGPGEYPVCGTGGLSCVRFRNPSKPSSSKPVQKPSKKKK